LFIGSLFLGPRLGQLVGVSGDLAYLAAGMVILLTGVSLVVLVKVLVARFRRMHAK
jgi:hypothetical protein